MKVPAPLTLTADSAQADPVFFPRLRVLCLATVVSAVFLFFQPFGLNQFGLPKFLVLFLALPVLAGLEFQALFSQGPARGDQISSRLALLFVLWSAFFPLIHATNHALDALGIIEAMAMYFVYLAAVRVQSTGSRNTLLFVICLSAIPLGLLALLQGLHADPLRLFLGLQSSRTGRWHMLSTLGHPSWTAELLVLLFPPMLALLHSKPRAARLAALLLGCTVILSGSRGAVIVLGILVWVAIRNGLLSFSTQGSMKREFLLALGLIGTAYFILLGTDPHRLLAWAPLTGRLGLWAAGLKLIGSHPFTGSGLHHTALVLPEGLRSIVSVTPPNWISGLPTVLVDRLDNDFLQISLERGLPSLVLFLCFFFRSIHILHCRILSQGEISDRAIRISLIGFGLFCLFSSPLHTPATAVIFWLFAGLVGASKSKDISCPFRQTCFRKYASLIPVSGLFLSVFLLIRIVSPALSANQKAGRAHQLLHQGHVKKTAELLAPISMTAPWLPEAGIDRARALVKLKRPEEALAELERAERWAASEWIWGTRAQAFGQLNLTKEAGLIIRKGLEVLPRSELLLKTQAELRLSVPKQPKNASLSP